MRRGRNRDGVFVDVGLLRDHISKLRRQYRTAEDLFASVNRLIRMADDDITHQHLSLHRDALQMCNYYEQMIRALSKVADEAVYVSYRIKHEIEDDTDRTRHISRRNLML